MARPCGPWSIKRAIADAQSKVDGLPDGFSFHDLRHYLASLLIASGADIKTVQARLRHASASTTLDVYGHLWPDADDSTRRPSARSSATVWLPRTLCGRTAKRSGVCAGQRG
jgi:integrase